MLCYALNFPVQFFIVGQVHIIVQINKPVITHILETKTLDLPHGSFSGILCFNGVTHNRVKLIPLVKDTRGIRNKLLSENKVLCDMKGMAHAMKVILWM